MGNLQSMFFKSNKVEAHWDTWVYYHEGTYYLYYLITEYSGGEGFGLATSEDGVTWSDHGWVLKASDKMVKYLGTGAVWKSPDFDKSGKFICNYSEWRKDNEGKETQNILFAWSKDLIHWEKFGDELMFAVDTQIYEKYGRWDCIYPVPCPEGGYYGAWTATPKGRGDLNGGIGFGRTEDGIHWKAIKPPQVIPDADEAGAIIRIGDRYYCMFGRYGTGMVSYYAEQIEGPYLECKKNSVVLSNYTYFSRFIQTGEEILVNHHAITRFRNRHGRPICYFAPLKKALVDEDGSLWLIYWQANDKLKRRAIQLNFDVGVDIGPIHVNMANKYLNTEEGVILEGIISFPGYVDEKDRLPAICIGHGKSQATCIWISGKGKVEFISIGPGKHDLVIEHSVSCDWRFGDKAKLCILLKQSVLEVYLDNVYICSYSLPAEADGAIGLIGYENMSGIKVWQV